MCTVSNTIENKFIQMVLRLSWKQYFRSLCFSFVKTSKPLCSKGHLCHYGGNELEKGRAV